MLEESGCVSRRIQTRKVWLIQPDTKSQMASSPVKVKGNGKAMATNPVNVDPTRYVNKTTKTIENPLNGKEIELTVEYELPNGMNYDRALALCNNVDADVWFWFDYGRRIQARYLATQKLGLDLEDENLQDLYTSFKAARRNMIDKNTSEERIQQINNFILGEQKFKPLADKLKEYEEKMKSGQGDNIRIVFGNPKKGVDGKPLEGETELEITKPTGIKGRQKKVKADSGETEAEVEAEVEA